MGDAPALGERRRRLLRRDHFGRRTGGLTLPPAADGLVQAEGGERDDDGGDDEHEERHAPPEGVGQQPGRQRADERTHGVGRPVHAEHPVAGFDGVVVGEQRVVRRVDHRLADRTATAGDGEHDERRGQPGQTGEAGPHQRATDDERHPPAAVGELGDRHLEGEGGDARHGDERQHRAQVEIERVADLRQQDPEGGPVELVDGVEAEQDHQRVHRLTATRLAEPLARVAHGVPHATHGTCTSVPGAGTVEPAASGEGVGSRSRRASTHRTYTSTGEDEQRRQPAGYDEEHEQHACRRRQEEPVRRGDEPLRSPEVRRTEDRPDRRSQTADDGRDEDVEALERPVAGEAERLVEMDVQGAADAGDGARTW